MVKRFELYCVWLDRQFRYIVERIKRFYLSWHLVKRILIAKPIQRLEGHSHFVQGVSIDPLFKYILTISNDRTLKVWKTNKSKKNTEFYHYGVII